MEAFKNLLLQNYYTVLYLCFLTNQYVYLEEVLRYKRQQLNTVLSTVYLNHYIYKYQALTEYTTLILGSSSSTRS